MRVGVDSEWGAGVVCGRVRGQQGEEQQQRREAEQKSANGEDYQSGEMSLGRPPPRALIRQRRN